MMSNLRWNVRKDAFRSILGAPNKPRRIELLEFNSRAGAFKLLLELVGFFLRKSFLDGLRGAIDEVFGFLQTKASRSANFLDDGDLLVGGNRLEDDVEVRRGFFGRRSSRATTRCGNHHAAAGWFDAVLVLEVILQLDRILDRETSELVAECRCCIRKICHLSILDSYRES